MNCSLVSENGKQVAVLLFKRDQLLYDIKNCAYIEGSVAETENCHNRHLIQDIGNTGNVDRVTRVLDLTVAKCKELLYPYTKTEIQSSSILDNRLREPGVYGIVLNVPSNVSQTTLYLLAKLIHEYLVCEAVSDWMSITNSAKSTTWKSKAEDAVKEIKSSLNARTSRTRRRMHPF